MWHYSGTPKPYTPTLLEAACTLAHWCTLDAHLSALTLATKSAPICIGPMQIPTWIDHETLSIPLIHSCASCTSFPTQTGNKEEQRWHLRLSMAHERLHSHKCIMWCSILTTKSTVKENSVVLYWGRGGSRGRKGEIHGSELGETQVILLHNNVSCCWMAVEGEGPGETTIPPATQ